MTALGRPRMDPDPAVASPRLNARDRATATALLAHLRAAGLLDERAAERAAQAQRQTGERIDVVLLQLGLLTDAALTDALADWFGLEVASADCWPDEPVAPDALDPGFVRRMRMIPVELSAACIDLVTSDPFATDTIAAVAYHVDRPARVRLATAAEMERRLTQLYAVATGQDKHRTPDASADGVPSDDVQRLRDVASEAPVIRLVSRLIAAAIERRASDVHIEPTADSVRVRFRIDGVMTDVERLPPDVHAGLLSRIKIIAGLDIAERRRPQDGRTKVVSGGREIDLRVATSALMHGESCVLRILDKDAVALDFTALGFAPEATALLTGMLAEPNGIVLVTGPTGSGKTTTLYAALASMNVRDRKVFTVEDPIEYQLAGINQMQVRPGIGLDFLHCLRSILRQDPDVIMIGEMRDAETARTGIQAALTGHLVLSTLHTNSAAASVTRLLDMGVDDYLLASTLTGVLAQRLVRRLCAACALPATDSQAPWDRLEPPLRAFVDRLPERRPRRACGCSACGGTGYRGRTAIVEILRLDDAARRLVKRGTTAREIEDHARAHGMETLIENGLRQVALGITTFAEVWRAARL